MRVTRLADIAIATVVGGLLIGALVVCGYVFGSFFLMDRHTTRRGFGKNLTELLREVWVVVISQPFMPLYYLYGRRMGSGTGVPIVFVHGYMQNRVGFVRLARMLSKRGLGPLFGFNYPWTSSIDRSASRLESFVAKVCEETGKPSVDLVCHSMGGLVAMEMMRDEAKRKESKIRRCVTIAAPHGGVMWEGPMIGMSGSSLRRGSKLLGLHAGLTVGVPVLSVFSSHDNLVFPKESSMLAARGGTDIEVSGLGHMAILFSPDVADHVAKFLAAPDAVESRA